MSTHALILNASFEPLHVVSWQRAVQLLFQGKVEVIEESNHKVRSVNFSIRIPAVLRLLKFVPLARRKSLIRFSRANIFLRDGYRCQYCAKNHPRSSLTLDHVVPVVQGGKKTWENIVTSCKKCNQNKGGRTPAQAGMRLVRKPIEPKWLPKSTLNLGIALMPDKWKLYIHVGK